MIWWHSVSSDDFFLYVEKYPSIPIPRRKGEFVSIPGHSGDLLFDQDAWDNEIQPYEIYFSGERAGNLPMLARKVVQWLMAPGYQRLEDDYNPGEFRLAHFTGGQEIENILNDFGRARIEFNCMPQRWSHDGEIPRKIAKGAFLVNPSIYTAAPLIVVQGAGSGSLTVGNTTLALSDCNGVTLDCDLEDAYRGAQNLNNTVSGDFPRLPAGETGITWTGGITGVEITPRWFWL